MTCVRDRCVLIRVGLRSGVRPATGLGLPSLRRGFRPHPSTSHSGGRATFAPLSGSPCALKRRDSDRRQIHLGSREVPSHVEEARRPMQELPRLRLACVPLPQGWIEEGRAVAPRYLKQEKLTRVVRRLGAPHTDWTLNKHCWISSHPKLE